MAYDPVTRLQSHVDSIAGQSPHPVLYLEIMRLVRLLIEHEGSSRQYPVAYAYCNWMHHANLDRNPEAIKMLGLIDAALLSNATNSTGKLLAQVASAFRLEDLQSQLTALFGAHNIDHSAVADSSVWENFLIALLSDVCDRPIYLRRRFKKGKSGPGKDTYDAILVERAENPGLVDLFVVKVTISYNENGVVGRPTGFYWTIIFQQQEQFISLNGCLYSVPLK